MNESTPHDPIAERAFVGSILASNGQVLHDNPDVSADLCHGFVTRAVLESCLSLHQQGAPVDPMSVTQWAVRSDYKIEALAFEITTMFTSGLASAASYYLPILQDQLSLRRLQDVSRWVDGQVQSRNPPRETILEAQRRIARCEPIADTVDHILPESIEDLITELDEMDRPGYAPRAIQTPIGPWNRAFGGLPEAAYLALGGRPGTGKTAMMEQIAFDLINDGHAICIFERDMSPKKLLKRMACRGALVPFWKFAKGYSTQAERDKIRIMYLGLGDSLLRLHNPVGLSADKLCAIVRREKKLYGIKAVFLDHIQVLDIGKMETVPGLTRASNLIRASVTETGIPHIVLFHINRQGAKGPRPTTEDVKGFDQLYGDVDGMAILWRERPQADLKPGESDVIKFYAAKNRDDGVSEEDMIFDGPALSFSDAPAQPTPQPKQKANR